MVLCKRNILVFVALLLSLSGCEKEEIEPKGNCKLGAIYIGDHVDKYMKYNVDGLVTELIDTIPDPSGGAEVEIEKYFYNNSKLTDVFRYSGWAGNVSTIPDYHLKYIDSGSTVVLMMSDFDEMGYEYSPHKSREYQLNDEGFTTRCDYFYGGAEPVITYQYVRDENNNIIEESEFERGSFKNKEYYEYDDKINVNSWYPETTLMKAGKNNRIRIYNFQPNGEISQDIRYKYTYYSSGYPKSEGHYQFKYRCF